MVVSEYAAMLSQQARFQAMMKQSLRVAAAAAQPNSHGQTLGQPGSGSSNSSAIAASKLFSNNSSASVPNGGATTGLAFNPLQASQDLKASSLQTSKLISQLVSDASAVSGMAGTGSANNLTVNMVKNLKTQNPTFTVPNMFMTASGADLALQLSQAALAMYSASSSGGDPNAWAQAQKRRKLS